MGYPSVPLKPCHYLSRNIRSIIPNARFSGLGVAIGQNKLITIQCRSVRAESFPESLLSVVLQQFIIGIIFKNTFLSSSLKQRTRRFPQVPSSFARSTLAKLFVLVSCCCICPAAAVRLLYCTIAFYFEFQKFSTR